MEKVVRFVADDGTVFEFEDDCYAYEENQTWEKIKDKIALFDFYLKPITRGRDLDAVGYIFLKDTSCVDLARAMFENQGLDHPFDTGCSVSIYAYDVIYEKWYDFSAKVVEMQAIQKQILSKR